MFCPGGMHTPGYMGLPGEALLTLVTEIGLPGTLKMKGGESSPPASSQEVCCKLAFHGAMTCARELQITGSSKENASS